MNKDAEQELPELTASPIKRTSWIFSNLHLTSLRKSLKAVNVKYGKSVISFAYKCKKINGTLR